MKITLKSKAEQRAEKACKLDAFTSINLLSIKKSISEMLSLIGRDEIFDQYTRHDISHVNMMLASLDYLIPKGTTERMTGADWLLIVLSIYFHDLGMLVTKKEYSERDKSKEYRDFQDNYLQDINNRESLKSLSDDDRQHFLYQEYVRCHHGDRIAKWILQEESSYVYYDENVTSVINGLVKDMRPLFRNDLAILCESHLLDDIDNLDKYKVGQSYGVSPDERGNVLYAALVLRTADLLHITSDRTPTVQFRIIAPTNPKSQIEWCKQNAVSSVSPKIAEDPEGNRDESLPMDTLEVNAFFENEDGFFSLIEYLKYVRLQLRENHRINEIAKKKYASKYDYPWKDVDDSTIQTKNFERRQLAFSIDQNKVLSLLVGETLYNNTSVTLRELSQNAIDAVKVKQYEIQTGKGNETYTPTIDVYWYEETRELLVCDNGTGMNMEIIENHLLKVGSSRYQDPSFQKKHPGYNSISRFGIGLLTCFLIADDIDILTNMDEREMPLLLKIRNVHGKYLLKHGCEKDSNLKLPYRTGTSLKLKVRPNIRDFNPEKILKDWILIPGCKFHYHYNDNSISIGFKTPREIIEKVLSAVAPANTEVFKVLDYSENGIEMAILLKYNQYMKEWSMVEVSNMWSNSSLGVVPWGISIEGIRIDANTPGFNNRCFIAYANMTGEHAPRTNVARSNINSASMSKMLDSLYHIYIKHIAEQKDKLCKEFSVTWAADEAGWMLNSFLKDRRYMSQADFIDVNILKHQLSDAELLLVEKEEKREFFSLNKLKQIGHFWTLESQAFDAANRLLKEIKLSNTSATALMTQLYGDKTLLEKLDVVLCKKRFYNIIDDILLRDFHICEVYLEDEQRRIDLKWEKEDNGYWCVIPRDHNSSKSTTFFIQVKDGVDISEMKYDGIKSAYGIIIPKRGGNEGKLSDFFLSFLEKIDMNEEEDAMAAQGLCMIITNIFEQKTSISNWNNYLTKIFEHREGNYYQEYVLKKVSKEQLLDLCNGSSFSLYDSSRWYRESQK